MSLKITVLPDDVANHIAAGEVIERPASVVKELIENSLDADATHIDIEIGIGGKAYIRVNDNGHGMDKENALLAFERHATSKITCTEDISSISTLGFRGEALPSIASVSKLKMLTRPPDAVIGTRIDIYGGELLNIMESGSAPGTFVEVKELFYKTPARLKFLKSPATELSYINNIISDEALAHPKVGFTVKNNAREQLNLSEKSDLLQRIAGLFGREITRELTEIHESAGSLQLRGFIGLPACHRANRNYQKIFVNARPVKDKVISHAIQQAYDTLIPKGRFPIAFLFLTLPFQLVDVNVHPTKMEIRFVNSQAIHDFVVESIRKTLRSSLRYTALALPSAPSDDHQEEDQAPQEQVSRAQIEFHAISPDTPPRSFRPPIPSDTQDIFSDEPFQTFPPPTRPSAETKPYPPTKNAFVTHIPSFPEGHPFKDVSKGWFSSLKPIGQFQETYLLVQGREDLFIIDQHAAHERIVYERLKKHVQETTLDIQQLLFPVSIELSHREQAVLEEHLEMLTQYGLELEPFGGTTYLLKAVPVLLSGADYKKMIYDIIDRLVEAGQAAKIEERLDEVLKLMACHSAIRANQPMQLAQITALLQQMDAIDLPYTCPHGRPTIIRISLDDLEKKFGRA